MRTAKYKRTVKTKFRGSVATTWQYECELGHQFAVRAEPRESGPPLTLACPRCALGETSTLRIEVEDSRGMREVLNYLETETCPAEAQYAAEDHPEFARAWEAFAKAIAKAREV